MASVENGRMFLPMMAQNKALDMGTIIPVLAKVE